jgi:TRAP-type C4-dicarboxylate transport system substrate-binding protein
MRERSNWNSNVVFVLVAALTVMLTWATPATSPAESKVSFRLAHQFPTAQTCGIFADRLAQLVKERSCGEFEIKVFPAQSLFKVKDYLKLMQGKTLDMAILPPT